jgi:hypothetical protein
MSLSMLKQWARLKVSICAMGVLSCGKPQEHGTIRVAHDDHKYGILGYPDGMLCILMGKWAP